MEKTSTEYEEDRNGPQQSAQDVLAHALLPHPAVKVVGVAPSGRARRRRGEAGSPSSSSPTFHVVAHGGDHVIVAERHRQAVLDDDLLDLGVGGGPGVWIRHCVPDLQRLVQLLLQIRVRLLEVRPHEAGIAEVFRVIKEAQNARSGAWDRPSIKL